MFLFLLPYHRTGVLSADTATTSYVGKMVLSVLSDDPLQHAAINRGRQWNDSNDFELVVLVVSLYAVHKRLSVC